MVGDSYDKDKLIDRAARNMEKAYAPYSNYNVGAALIGKSGTIYDGANIEMCIHRATHAERMAIVNAVFWGEREFIAIAVVTDDPKAPYPCGQCRQDLAEFDLYNDGRLEIIAANLDGLVRKSTLAELLPERFGPGNL